MFPCGGVRFVSEYDVVPLLSQLVGMCHTGVCAKLKQGNVMKPEQVGSVYQVGSVTYSL